MTKKTTSPAVPRPVLKHWDQLRIDYVRATPRQCLGPIVSRLLGPLHWGPNPLITGISAVEAFARSLVVEVLAKSRKTRKIAVYDEVKEFGAVELVVQYLALRKAGTPADVFGEERWRSLLSRLLSLSRRIVLRNQFASGGASWTFCL